jgi:hypothetical protein
MGIEAALLEDGGGMLNLTCSPFAMLLSLLFIAVTVFPFCGGLGLFLLDDAA